MTDVPAELATLLSGPLFESIALVDSGDLTDDERAVVPEWWLRAVELSPGNGVERAMARWQSALPDALPGFYALIREHGIGVFLGRSKSERKPLLAYAASLPSGETICWYGFAPTPSLRHQTLDLAGLPSAPRRLYTELHDGFKLASGIHNGFPCSSEWFAVGEDLDAESIEIVGRQTPPDVDHLVSVFYDFGASSVCVELDGATDDRFGWVVSGGQVQLVENIWPTIDRWMQSLIEP